MFLISEADERRQPGRTQLLPDLPEYSRAWPAGDVVGRGEEGLGGRGEVSPGARDRDGLNVVGMDRRAEFKRPCPGDITSQGADR